MGLNHRRGLSNVVSMIEDELRVRETERGGVVGRHGRARNELATLRERAEAPIRPASPRHGPRPRRHALPWAKLHA